MNFAIFYTGSRLIQSLLNYYLDHINHGVLQSSYWRGSPKSYRDHINRLWLEHQKTYFSSFWSEKLKSIPGATPQAHFSYSKTGLRSSAPFGPSSTGQRSSKSSGFSAFRKTVFSLRNAMSPFSLRHMKAPEYSAYGSRLVHRTPGVSEPQSSQNLWGLSPRNINQFSELIVEKLPFLVYEWEPFKYRGEGVKRGLRGA